MVRQKQQCNSEKTHLLKKKKLIIIRQSYHVKPRNRVKIYTAHTKLCIN